MLTFLSKHTHSPSGTDGPTNFPETQLTRCLQILVYKWAVYKCKSTNAPYGGDSYPPSTRHQGKTGHKVYQAATVPQMGGLQIFVQVHKCTMGGIYIHRRPGGMQDRTQGPSGSVGPTNVPQTQFVSRGPQLCHVVPHTFLECIAFLDLQLKSVDKC